MAFNTNITPGNPPLLWSNIDEAFSRINENFDILVATIGTGSGLIPINFETLDTSVSPTVSDTYSLGSSTKKWRNVYTEEWSSVGTSIFNGVWLGSAQIKGIGSSVDLPAGSTVNGDLIINPDKTFFKSAQVDNGDRVEANEFSDTLNFLSGNGITMTVGSPGESITIANDGIVSINPGTGISATTVSGVASIVNTGVVSLDNIGSLPSGRTPGAGIYVDSASGSNIKITNTGILGFDNSGFGINVSVDSSTGLATVNLSTGVVATAAFRSIVVTGTTGQPTMNADSPADTLTINAGYGIILNSSDDPEILTVSVDPEVDIKGSVFGTDSSVIVDAEDRKVYADLIGNVTGNVVGNVTGTASNATLADTATLANTIDITNTNGLSTIYYPTFVENRTTGQILRGDVNLTYRTDTDTLTAGSFVGNLTGAVTGNIFTNLIDSADSSQIVVTPLMRFSSDVVIENDLTVDNNIQVPIIAATSITATVSKLGKILENTNNLSGATGVVAHDCSSSQIFRHTSIANNFTADFTNFELANDQATSLTLILVQGGTAYIPNAVRINGISQTILWQGSSPPLGNTNKTDIVSFSVINTAGSYAVFGQLTSFGT